MSWFMSMSNEIMDPDTELFDVGENYENLIGEIYDVLKSISDPEKPQTLEDLDVINEKDIFIKVSDQYSLLTINITPTVPHCELANMIGSRHCAVSIVLDSKCSSALNPNYGLSVRLKLEKYWGKYFKIDVFVKEGTHNTVDAVNRQINDKERIAAAMEQKFIREVVEKCIKEDFL